jgi:hypothetical protein
MIDRLLSLSGTLGVAVSLYGSGKHAKQDGNSQRKI